MRTLASIAGAVTLASAPAFAQQERLPLDRQALAAVSPALESYASRDLFGGEWTDAALSPRDRGLVTLAALIARNQTEDLEAYAARALDAGATPAEISEIVTHLAFYAGWGAAMAAAEEIEEVFEDRGVSAEDLPAAEPAERLPLDQEAEDQRQAFVQERYGDVSQGVVDNTERLLFLDLWLRPALAPRDRSLVTVAALISAGHVEQIPFHLNRAMDNGLSRSEASAMLSHLAFYAGWPNVFSAMPVAKEVFEGREG